MAYAPPDFNLDATVWFIGNVPGVNPPDIPTMPCQLYRYGRQNNASSLAFIRVPNTFSGIAWGRGADLVQDTVIIECPSGSGAFYTVAIPIWMHRGFVNEYISLMCSTTDAGRIVIAGDTDLQ